VQWRNAGRYQAYQLSPYDETIVIDADYLVFDQNILKIFECEWDYTVMRQARGLTQEFPVAMGTHSLPYVWATVFAFRRTPKAEMFFDLVQRVQDNYNYYRELFNIEQRNFRNDYAFAIANIIINGYSINESQGIPWTMFTIDKPIERMVSTEHNIRIYHADSAVVAPHQCIHVMDKQYLQSQDFKQFVNALTQ
jgi:hypothetical protein